MKQSILITLVIILTWSLGHADLNPSGNVYQIIPSSNVVTIAAATTVVKGTAGTLRRVVVTTPIAGTIKLFDLATASCTGTPSTNAKAVITMVAGNPFFLEFQQSFANGICALSSAAFNATFIFD